MRPESGQTKLDLRLVGPAIAVWVSMWVATGWDWGKWACGGGAVVVAVATIAVSRRRRRRVGDETPGRVSVAAAWAMCVMLASGALIGGLRVMSVEQGVVAQAASRGSVVHVDVVLRDVRATTTWNTVVAQAVTEQMTWAGRSYRVRQPVIVMAPAATAQEWLSFPIGSVVAMTAKASATDLADGTAAQLTVLDQAEVVRPPPAWQRVIESMRRGLSQAMVNNPSDQAALVPALVVGDTSAMPEAVVTDFTTTGLTHLTAVSGANLAVLFVFLSSVARRVGVRGVGLTIVSAVGVVVFVAMCHSEPSVLRAAAMGLVSLVALGRGAGSRSGVRGLCLAVMALCWIDPWISRSWGLALSVLACTGIIIWGGRWAQVLGRWLPGWVAEAMAIPLSAQLITQPVVSYLSGAVSVSGLIANAAAEPWVAPATVFGLMAALVSALSATVASWLGYVAGWCAQPVLTISHALADLPGASHTWPTTPVGLVAIGGICLGLAWVMPLLLSRVWVVVAVTVALVATMVAAPYQPGWPGGGWQITACDVGQGDAVVVRVDEDSVILIDTGLPDSGVVGCLNQLGVKRIDLLVLTHFHADHAGGFAEVVDAWPVAGLLVPRGGGDSDAVLRLADERGIAVTEAQTGTRATVGGVTVQVVSAYQSVLSSGDGEESSSENDESLVLRVDTGQMSLLDTGDVEVLGQQAALHDPVALKVDVLKVPHHGSARQDPDFLKATGARIALISVGADNSYGHPTAGTVTELVNDRMEVIRTDEHGSIAIAHTDQWTVTTQR